MIAPSLWSAAVCWRQPYLKHYHRIPERAKNFVVLAGADAHVGARARLRHMFCDFAVTVLSLSPPLINLAVFHPAFVRLEHACHPGVSGLPQERTFGQCPRL
jgi:hypothetical protein